MVNTRKFVTIEGSKIVLNYAVSALVDFSSVALGVHYRFPDSDFGNVLHGTVGILGSVHF